LEKEFTRQKSRHVNLYHLVDRRRVILNDNVISLVYLKSHGNEEQIFAKIYVNNAINKILD
jgi:hypothetical protein